MKKCLYSLLALTLVFSAACIKQDPLNLKARAIWLKHQRVLEGAIKGERTDGDELQEAAIFFYHVAGIIIPGGHSPVIDFYITRETAGVMKPLRIWYKENGDRLYWDEASSKVLLRPGG
jgi:hypothetical protein